MVSKKLAGFSRRVLTLQGVQKDKSFCNLGRKFDVIPDNFLYLVPLTMYKAIKTDFRPTHFLHTEYASIYK